LWITENGAGGSLTIHGNLILIPCDGMDAQYEAALSKDSGEIVWKVERGAKPILDTLAPDRRKAYGTSFVTIVRWETDWCHDGFQPVGCAGSCDRRRKVVCELSGGGFSNVPVPVTDGKILVISTGFMKPDVGDSFGWGEGDATESHVVWKQKAGAPNRPSPVLLEWSGVYGEQRRDCFVFEC